MPWLSPCWCGNIRSTTQARDGLSTYDRVPRLNDARFVDGDVSDIKRYICLEYLGQAFMTDEQVVVLINEVDKADFELPNDLLVEARYSRYITPSVFPIREALR
ncbi:hypothetical protein NKDENANG_01036 [Candidatus Entotheonellaceae bacterium PAL068K]